MKKKIYMIIAILGYIFSSCTFYDPEMSEAGRYPIKQKLPNMDFDWYAGDDVSSTNVDVIKDIVHNEINKNIVTHSGQKSGTIEIVCERAHLKRNFVWTIISGLTGFGLNIFGMPLISTEVELSLSFYILDTNGDIVDNFNYSSSKQGAMGFYYGKSAKVHVVEAAKDIIKQFRDDINVQSENLIAKLGAKKQLEDRNTSSSVYHASSQLPVDSGKKETAQSDVDQNIPQSDTILEDTYALIIANEAYQFVDDVNFAAHDGEVFKEYCVKTLGIPERQIRYCANASYGVISDGVDWLKYALNNFEGSKAIVYYCGHGIPDEKTGDTYIIPIDGKGTNTTTCYSLHTLYTTLANTNASNITYFMDACFTGANKEGSMLVAARGVAREAKKEVLAGKAVVFSASSGDETAMTYPEKGHGLFTYFLLKKLQETQGNVSYSDLADYINKNVKKEAFLINEKPQTPVVATSIAASGTWETMTLK